MKTIKLLSFIFILILSITTQAKWATIEDASIKTSYDSQITVNKDGTSQEIREIKFQILKEPGRDIAANYTLKYNGNSEKIKIIAAKTIYKNKEYKLDSKSLEDKPLASAHGGFDQTRQILLAFPKAEVGADIYLKYSITTKEVPLQNFYAALFDIGDDTFTDKAHIKLQSKIPLYLLINDPKKVLNINKDHKDGKIFNLEITLKKPFYQSVINEPHFGILNHKYLTWVSISSLNKWEELGTRFSESYKKVFTQTMPKDFVQIASVAAKKTTDVEKINTVTSMFSDKIQYMGDWRTVRGQFIPRDLAQISSSQLGDCKDFAASTAAILHSIGFKTQIALIRRGERSFYPEALPTIAAFNHAFVKVTDKNGKVYWIDPTNFQSMAGNIFPDIANKMALVIDVSSPKYEKISNIDSQKAKVIISRQLEVLKNNKIIETGNFTLQNENAYGLTGAALQTSESNIKDIIYNNLSDSLLEEKNKKVLRLPNLKSRIVKDISLSYKFEQNNKIIKTNLGLAIKINDKSLNNFFNISQDSVTDIFVFQHPFSYKRQTIIKNINIKNIESLNKQINTPWLFVERKCFINKDNNAQIDDTIIIYKNLITNQELKTPEFIALKEALIKDFKNVAIVFAS